MLHVDYEDDNGWGSLKGLFDGFVFQSLFISFDCSRKALGPAQRIPWVPFNNLPAINKTICLSASLSWQCHRALLSITQGTLSLLLQSTKAGSTKLSREGFPAGFPAECAFIAPQRTDLPGQGVRSNSKEEGSSVRDTERP